MRAWGVFWGAMAGAISVAQAPEQEPPFVRLLNQPIAIKEAPVANWGPSASTYGWQGWQLLFDGNGNLVGRKIEDGGWKDAARLLASKPAAPVTVPIKVVLITRTVTAVPLPDGRIGLKRGTLEPRQIQTILESLARLKTLAEAQAFGRIAVEFDITEDDTWLHLPADDELLNLMPGRPELNFQIDAIGPEFLRRRVLPAANRAPFSSDGTPVPGPYLGLFVIHGTLNDRTAHEEIHGQPLSVLAYNTFTNGDPADALDQFFVEGLQRQAAMRLNALDGDLSVPISPANEVTVGDALLNADASLTSPNWLAARAPKPTVLTRDEAWGNLYTRLPNVDRFALEEWAGGSLGEPPHRGKITPWNGAGKQLLLVDPAYLDVTLDLVSGEQGLTALGWLQRDNAELPVIVLDVTGRARSGESDLALLGLDAASLKAPDAVTPASGLVPVNMRVESVPNQPNVWRIGRDETANRGYVRLPALPSGGRYGLRLRTENREPLALQFLDSQGNYLYEYRLIGRPLASPTVNGERVPTMNLVVPTNGEWQNVVIDLSPVTTRGQVAEVRLGTPIGSEFFERTMPGPVPVDYATLEADLSALDVTAVDLPMVVAGPVSLLRAEPHDLTDQEWLQVKEALASEDEADRMTAIAALTRHRHPEAAASLLTATRTFSPAGQALAMDALLHQGSTDRVRALADSGPLPYIRTLAFARLTAEQRADMFGYMSRLVISPSWLDRTTALYGMVGRTEPLIAPSMTLALVDPDAGVRVAVLQQWFTFDELSARRLMFTALNDPSEDVRIAANIALARFPDEAVKAEARRGLRDDSPYVRAGLVRQWGASGVELAAIKTAITDTDPMVRMAVLDVDGTRRFFTVEEVAARVDDPDRRVAMAAVANLRGRGEQVAPSVWDAIAAKGGWLAAYVRYVNGTAGR